VFTHAKNASSGHFKENDQKIRKKTKPQEKLLNPKIKKI
jgi:hypothetical protein